MDLSHLPSWANTLIGVAGGGAVVMAYISKGAKLITDLRNVINHMTVLLATIKTEIKDPGLTKEYNGALEDIQAALNDIGLTDKAKMIEKIKIVVPMEGQKTPIEPAKTEPPK